MGGFLFLYPAFARRPRPRRVFASLLVAVLCFGSVARLPAASPPDWLKPLLAEDISAWKDKYSAVQLLDYERTQFTGRDRVVELSRSAVRITSEAGRDEVNRRFRYNPDTGRVRGIRAWVVSADGKKTRSFTQGDFVDQVAEFSSHFWNSERLLRLNTATAEIEIGGVVAYEFEVSRDAGFFDASFQFLDRLPTLHSIMEVVPAEGGKLEWHSTSSLVPPPISGNGPGSLRWEMDRREPVPAEQPTAFLANPLRVSVRCTTAGALSQRLATWEEFSKMAAEIVEPRMETTGAVLAKATELTAGKVSRWDRVRALCDFVQRDVAYLSVTIDKDSLAGYRPHPANECLGNRFGDCKDKATLLTSLLRASGDNGFLVLVFSGNPTVVPPDWPSACFNHAIVGIPADADVPAHWPVVDVPGPGKLVIFDATDPVTPLGVLSEGDQGSHALVASRAGAGIVQLPGESDASLGLHREIAVVLNPTGAVQVKFSEDRIGSAGAESQLERTFVREERFGRTIEEAITRSIPLARNIRWSETWIAETAKHQISAEFSAERYLRALGKDRAMFNPLPLAAAPPLNPWKLAHEGTTWFGGFRLKETVRVQLPAGFDVEELPKAVAIEQPLASCRVTYRLEGREVVIDREVVRAPRFFDQSDYEALRTLTQKIQETERRPVVLKRVAAVTPAS